MIAPPTRSAIAELEGLARDLLAILGPLAADLRSAASAVVNVERYLDLLEGGARTDDAVLALQGAELLTGVNKGMLDTVSSSTDIAEDLAWAVSRTAIGVARQLRADAGLTF